MYCPGVRKAVTGPGAVIRHPGRGGSPGAWRQAGGRSPPLGTELRREGKAWRGAALRPSFGCEIHPTLGKNPRDGGPFLREEGYPETIIETVLSHAEHLSLPRDTPLKKALFACDELSGFVHACALVRPTGLDGLEPKSVRKKLKQPSFAAGVHREDVFKGADELGVELDDHIRVVVDALKPIASELGLPT